jgi:formate-dependent phosphoribosylglycinamide formyltransferase (GAR transformylase)
MTIPLAEKVPVTLKRPSPAQLHKGILKKSERDHPKALRLLITISEAANVNRKAKAVVGCRGIFSLELILSGDSTW